MMKTSIKKQILLVLLSSIFWACGPSLQGVVVMPDGSQIKDMKISVYTEPRTDSVKVKPDGTFKLSKNLVLTNAYTLIAEDKDGNLGFVKNYKPADNPKEKVVIKLSKEIEAKDAVMEGEVYINPDSGPGEKIFKSSQ